MFAAPAAPAAPAAKTADASATEGLIKSIRGFVDHVVGLDPGEALLNLAISAAVVLAAMGLIWALRRIFDHLLRRFTRAAPAEAKRPETPQAVGVTWLLLKLFIWLIVVGLVADVWGLDFVAWLSGGAGTGLLRAVGVLILAVAAVEVAGFGVNRLIDGVAKRSRNARRAAQIRTLGPLIRGLIQAVVVVVATLTFLSEIGVSVAPLLASAGVVGVAVGFGSQTLVKDFLTGLFLVAEDVVSVGDNVRIADVGGTVEAMTLRTIRLRDQDGTLHIFPYSEAQVIHNRTASFSSYVADVMVTYETDLDQAMGVMARVGEEMRQSPEFARKITRPFEVLGVERLDPTGVLLRARATTRPKDQWEVGREYNRRLKQAFETEGVNIAYRPPGPPAATAPTAPDPEGGKPKPARPKS